MSTTAAGTTLSTAARGLEGVSAAETEMSWVDGANGVLLYVGIPIGELATHSTFEETVYLLWNRRLPNRRELDQFTAEIRAAYALPAPLISLIQQMPKNAPPIHVLRTLVSSMASFDPKPDDTSVEGLRARGLNIMAKVPALLAYFDRFRKGRPFVAPDTSLNVAGNFLYMLNGQKPTETMNRALDVCLILHTDHGLNASTFTARVIASTLSDMYSCITGAIGALKGPLHGGANEVVMHMLNEIGSIDKVEVYIKAKLEKKDKVMGFGHRVYKAYDPRARFLKAFSKDLAQQTGNMKYYEMSAKIEQVMADAVAARGIYPNVDFYSATTYHCIGLDLDLFTPMFAIARVGGWAGHVIEQRSHNRLIRPSSDYTGPKDAPYVPIDQRA